jgi:predicted amidohydrolase
MQTENKIGRPVRVASISFEAKSLQEISEIIDREGSKGVDIIALPEMWKGTNSEPETLDGVVVSTMAQLAKKHSMYIVCPILRKGNGFKLVNSSVLLDRQGNIVFVYDKVYPYWEELKTNPPVEIGEVASVYEADFGKIGLVICFDANFPEVWKRLADQGAELIIWSSAWSGGSVIEAHAICNNYYIVTSTWVGDCTVFDITGNELLYEKSEGVNVSRITLNLDRGIYHENYNIEKRDRLLKAYAGSILQELQMNREQWFVLKSSKPGISARELARSYGMEELRDYRNRSRFEIDKMRGCEFSQKPNEHS